MAGLRSELIDLVAELAEIEIEEVRPDVPLKDLGVDSLMVLEIVALIEKRLGIEIPESEIARVRTLDDIFGRFASGDAGAGSETTDGNAAPGGGGT